MELARYKRVPASIQEEILTGKEGRLVGSHSKSTLGASEKYQTTLSAWRSPSLARLEVAQFASTDPVSVDQRLTGYHGRRHIPASTDPVSVEPTTDRLL